MTMYEYETQHVYNIKIWDRKYEHGYLCKLVKQN